MRARRSLAVPVTLTFALLAPRALAAIDYGARGPLTFTTTDLPAGTAGTTGSKLVVPAGAGPFPVVVASHGFSASPANQLGWAEHFASHGLIVAVPAFPNPLAPNTATNAGVIEALVAHARATVPSADPTRVGLEGHSAGGLATVVAAARLAPGAVVLFDPVDRADEGKRAYATLCSPTLALFAQAGICNNQAGWRAFATSTRAPLVAATVVGATHCDGENAARALCAIGCLSAGADATRQRVHARYATAFLLARLRGDAQAATELTATALGADPALSGPVVQAGAGCTGPSDAGADAAGPDAAGPDASADAGPVVPGSDAAPPGPSADASAPGPAPAPSGASPAPGPTPTASGPAGTEGAPADDAGCGCIAAGSAPRAGVGLFGAAIALGLALARRRRAS